VNWAIEEKSYSQRRACGWSGWIRVSTAISRGGRTMRVCVSVCGSCRQSAGGSVIAACTYC
jgi:hypothetical protein